LALAIFIIGFIIFVGQSIIGTALFHLLTYIFPATSPANMGNASWISVNIIGLFMIVVGVALFFLYRKERPRRLDERYKDRFPA